MMLDELGIVWVADSRDEADGAEFIEVAGGGGGGPIIGWPVWSCTGGLKGSLCKKKSVSTSECSRSLTAELMAMERKLLLSLSSSSS